MHNWEEMSTGSSSELEPAASHPPLAPGHMKSHPRTVLYRLELIVFAGYFIYIYAANKEFSPILNIFWKMQLSKITANTEQKSNYNICHYLRSIWHLLIKLLSGWDNLQGFALPFPLCQPIILMTKTLRKHSQVKNYCVILFIDSLDDLADSNLGKLLFGGIVKSRIKTFFKKYERGALQIEELLVIWILLLIMCSKV